MSEQLSIPAWPEFKHGDAVRYQSYMLSLPVVYVDNLPYRLDDDYLWLLPMREEGTARRFEDRAKMIQFMDEHTEGGTDWRTHAHRVQDTKVASIPMPEKEAMVVHRFGDYAFIKMPLDAKWIQLEGKDMQNCLSYVHVDYCHRYQNGEIDLYSMVDATTGIPVVDIEIALTRSSYGGPVEESTLSQLRGIRNECPPRDKYLEAVDDFLTHYGKDWKIEGTRTFDGGEDGPRFKARLAELRACSKEA